MALKNWLRFPKSHSEIGINPEVENGEDVDSFLLLEKKPSSLLVLEIWPSKMIQK